MIENMSTADFILYWLDVIAMSNGFRNEQLLLVNMLDTANAPVDNSEQKRLEAWREKINFC